MGAKRNRAARAQGKVEGRLSERRQLRSGVLADALRLQLEACRAEEGLDAIVVSDELGFCVAHAGGNGTHADLAARLPLLAHPAQRPARDSDEDELTDRPAGMTVTTFSIAGAKLHACAVGPSPAEGHDGPGVAVLARVASGFTRLLAE